MLVSAVALTSSIGLMILFAAMRTQSATFAMAHMGVAAVVAIGFAAKFFRSNDALRQSGASQSAVAANTARYTAYVFAWAAIVLWMTYATGIETWREWLLFSIACTVLAGLSLAFASLLQKDADAGKDDPGLLKLAHWLAIILLAGMVVTIVGLVLDGKMMRFLNPRFSDWVANNVFFFGAIALAAISGYALKHKPA